MIRHIGYACINMTLSEGVPPSKKVLTSRTLRQASFTLPKINDIVRANCSDLMTILKWNHANDIRLFRISSEIFPFMDHPDLAYKVSDLSSSRQIVSALSECGKFARDNGIRLTTHPGPYNCLGSPNEFTVKKTLLCLEMHTLLGELLGMDDFVINLHVGGSYGGDFQNTADRFVANFDKLSNNAKRWLTIENDDKSSLWTVTKLHKMIHSKVGIPIIADLHHWLFCNEEPIQDAVSLALSTWGDKTPKIHYSESADGKRPQAHSDYLKNVIPDYCPDKVYDCMIEAKAKELAVLKYKNEKAVVF